MVEATKMTFGESNVGISLFLGDVNNAHVSDVKAGQQQFMQIPCAYKHRFSDFIVNEIDQNGEVVWYRDENANFQKWKQSN